MPSIVDSSQNIALRRMPQDIAPKPSSHIQNHQMLNIVSHPHLSLPKQSSPFKDLFHQDKTSSAQGYSNNHGTSGSNSINNKPKPISILPHPHIIPLPTPVDFKSSPQYIQSQQQQQQHQQQQPQQHHLKQKDLHQQQNNQQAIRSRHYIQPLPPYQTQPLTLVKPTLRYKELSTVGVQMSPPRSIPPTIMDVTVNTNNHTTTSNKRKSLDRSTQRRSSPKRSSLSEFERSLGSDSSDNSRSSAAKKVNHHSDKSFAVCPPPESDASMEQVVVNGISYKLGECVSLRFDVKTKKNFYGIIRKFLHANGQLCFLPWWMHSSRADDSIKRNAVGEEVIEIDYNEKGHDDDFPIPVSLISHKVSVVRVPKTPEAETPAKIPVDKIMKTMDKFDDAKNADDLMVAEMLLGLGNVI